MVKTKNLAVIIFMLAFLAGIGSAAETARERAVILTRYIQDRYWDEDMKTYLNWVPEKEGKLRYATMWGLGIQFSALAGATALESAPYEQWMGRFATGMEQYFNKRKKMYSAYIGGTDDIYYDDNHWLILDYIEAYELTKNRSYLNKAKIILDACLGGVDGIVGGGSYWRNDTAGFPTKNTCANAPLAASLFRIIPHVSPVSQKRHYYSQGLKILKWTRENLQDEDGLMWDNINIQTKNIDKRKYTYNTALMIQSHLGLYKITKDKKQIAEAIRLANASAHWLKQESEANGSQYYDGPVRFTVHLIEALLDVYQINGDRTLLENCQKTADHCWLKWHRDEQAEIMDLAAIARIQWLIAAAEHKVPEEKNVKPNSRWRKP